MKRLIWLVVLSTAAAGCGDGMMNGMGGTDRMAAMVGDLRGENDAHHGAIVGAASTAELNAEMVRHEAVTDDMMNDMGSLMEEMSHCGGGGMQEMRGMHEAMMGEMANHATTMGAVVDPAAGTTEADRHAGAMHRMLGGMDTAIDHMDCGM